MQDLNLKVMNPQHPFTEMSPQTYPPLNTRDRYRHESEVGAMLRHMLENSEIQADQQIGWDQWWEVDDTHSPRDIGYNIAEDKDMQWTDYESAIEQRDMQPQGGRPYSLYEDERGVENIQLE